MTVYVGRDYKIRIAVKNGLNIPIVYNSNGYDITDTLRLLDDIVDATMYSY